MRAMLSIMPTMVDAFANEVPGGSRGRDHAKCSKVGVGALPWGHVRMPRAHTRYEWSPDMPAASSGSAGLEFRICPPRTVECGCDRTSNQTARPRGAQGYPCRDGHGGGRFPATYRGCADRQAGVCLPGRRGRLSRGAWAHRPSSRPLVRELPHNDIRAGVMSIPGSTTSVTAAEQRSTSFSRIAQVALPASRSRPRPPQPRPTPGASSRSETPSATGLPAER